MWKEVQDIRLSPRTHMAASGPMAVQDLCDGTHSPIQGKWGGVEPRGSLGRSGRETNLTAGKKTIETLRQTKSQSATSRLLRISRDQVHHVMARSVEFGLSLRSNTHIYHHLSVDEKSVHGRQFATILYEENGTVLDVVDGRRQECVETLITNNLTPIQRAGVETISMDMWEAFMNASKKLLPNAKICHDLYHLVTYLNKAVDMVRRREVKTHQELKNTRYLFLSDTLRFTEKQRVRFDAITQTNLAVSRAWHFKEDFRDIIKMRIAERGEAFCTIHFWITAAMESGIPEIMKVAQMFCTHLQGIVNAVALGRNNGRAERMNGSIQELQTVARGYRDVEHFRTAVLFFHGGLVLHRDFLI